jgi:hypothetical protein
VLLSVYRLSPSCQQAEKATPPENLLGKENRCQLYDGENAVVF